LKFQPDRAEGVNLVTRYDIGCIWVGATPFAHAVLVPWAGVVQPWPVDHMEQLRAEHFALALPLQPELVVFGSGSRLRFVPAALLRSLIEHGVGVETMDTAAACRTYNVLAGEGRHVLAALLPAGA
jgi:uncharacterized protein